MQNVTAKTNFLLQVYIVRVHSRCDLDVLLITTMCDMTYLILHCTQDIVFNVAEMVFQSSCTTSRCTHYEVRWSKSSLRMSVRYFILHVSVKQTKKNCES